jgi:hypothetical protein
LTITGAGAPLTVIANVPGTGSTGSGPGSGTGGGGTGGGGGSTGGATPPVTLPDRPAVITYTVKTQTGGADGASGTADDTLVFSFDEPVEGLRASDVTITKGNPGNIELTGPVGSSTDKKTWTFDLVKTSAEQGQVTVSITKNKVDPDPRAITVYGPPVLGAPELIQITSIELWKGQDGVQTTGAALFKVNTDTLKIVLATAAAITVDNIGWNANLDPYGLKAEIAKPTNLRPDSDFDNNFTYWADVNVIKQGQVQFFLKGRAEKKEATDLMGAAFEPALKPVAYAAKAEPMQYNVKTDGNKNNETTTTLTFTFAYAPTVFDTEFNWTGGIDAIGITKKAGVDGYWEKGTAPTWAPVPATGDPYTRVYTLTLDSTTDKKPELRAREGFVDVKINQFGFTTDTKTIEVHRKPLIGFTVTPLQTVGITTHLMITFEYDLLDPDDPADDQDNWGPKFEYPGNTGDGFGYTAFEANAGTASNILVKTSKGRVLANQDTAASNNIVASTWAADDAPGYGYKKVEGVRYILKLDKPILPADMGGATVTITGTTSDHPTHPELTDKPQPVTLVHGGLVKYTVGATALAGGLTATLIIDFDQPLLDPFAAGYTATAPKYLTAGNIKISDWDADWTKGNTGVDPGTAITTPTVTAGTTVLADGTAAQLLEGQYPISLGGTALTATLAKVANAPIIIEIADPTGANYESYLIDPNPVRGDFIFLP